MRLFCMQVVCTLIELLGDDFGLPLPLIVQSHSIKANNFRFHRTWRLVKMQFKLLFCCWNIFYKRIFLEKLGLNFVQFFTFWPQKIDKNSVHIHCFCLFKLKRESSPYYSHIKTTDNTWSEVQESWGVPSFNWLVGQLNDRINWPIRTKLPLSLPLRLFPLNLLCIYFTSRVML